MKGVHAVVITGLSGSGKSTAIRAFEDLGYYCVDNLPVVLLPGFLRTIAELEEAERRVALVMDVRERTFLEQCQTVFHEVRQGPNTLEVLFLEAGAQTLIQRFSQTRRRHPMATEGGVTAAIAQERHRLTFLRDQATRILDTSVLNVHQLRTKIFALYGGQESLARLRLGVVSFGFKHGLPAEADMVFDVRFLPNPFFVPELRDQTGLDATVASYVLAHGESDKFLEMIGALLHFLLPLYRREGKAYLTIGIGCTGGRHRSVCIAEELVQMLREQGETVWISHRDIDLNG